MGLELLIELMCMMPLLDLNFCSLSSSFLLLHFCVDFASLSALEVFSLKLSFSVRSDVLKLEFYFFPNTGETRDMDSLERATCPHQRGTVKGGAKHSSRMRMRSSTGKGVCAHCAQWARARPCVEDVTCPHQRIVHITSFSCTLWLR